MNQPETLPHGPSAEATSGPATESLWFYVKGKKKLGPVSLTELRSLVAEGQLHPTDLVLRQGAAKWAAVSSIDGLLPPSPAKTIAPISGSLDNLTATSPLNQTVAQGQVLAALPVDQPEKIGRYRIEKILGEGGFGVVFLAYDDELRRQIAIKVPHRKRIARPEDAEAYLAEARILASLDHPHIVPVFDVGRSDDGLCFVVSKFIEGSDLAAKIKASRLSFRESANLVATISEALHHAHQKKLTHRDVKSANILLDTAGKPYLTDFGLALKEEDFGKALPLDIGLSSALELAAVGATSAHIFRIPVHYRHGR